MASVPPEGEVALLFTDVENSTQLAWKLESRWPAVLAVHHGVLNAAISAEGGYVDGTHGDAFFAVFSSAPAAARAAISAQRTLRAHPWPHKVGELRVRMGIHFACVDRGPTGYVGLEVHRAARVAAAAHGGQVLMTQAAARAVGDTLGAEPIGFFRLKDFPVPERLYCARIDGRGPECFPPPRTLELRPTNLPALGRELRGREIDVGRVVGALRKSRLVTITGRGGVGKTSIAMAVATAELVRFAGGAWWIPLAGATSATVWTALVAGLHCRASADEPPVDVIARRLEGHGATLLVLDNFEHVLEFAPWLCQLLDRLPDLHLLVTSQAALRKPPEEVVRLEPLAERPALELLTEGAVRARGRSLDPDELAAAAEVCRSLDGLPLAIELAAARLGVLTMSQLRERLETSPELLRTDRPAEVRHRSLASMVEWTLDHVGDDSRELFARLGVFATPVELTELEAVAGADGLDVLEAASALVDHAVLARVETGDGRVRFGLPNALRPVAEARLLAGADADRWRLVHARRQLERVWPARLRDMATVEAYRNAEEAVPEALAAVARVGGQDPVLQGALAAALGVHMISGPSRSTALHLLRSLRPDASWPPTQRALASYGMTSVAHADGRPAVPYLDDTVTVATDADPPLAVAALAQRATHKAIAADVVGAVADAVAATALARTLEPAVLAGALLWEAQALIKVGQITLAAARLKESRAVATVADGTAAWTCESLAADIAYESGQFREALDHGCRSLLHAEDRGADQLLAFDLVASAACLARLGDVRAAAEMLGMADAHCATAGGTREQIVHGATGLTDLLEAIAAADPAEMTEARAAGAAVPVGQRVTRALGLASHLSST